MKLYFRLFQTYPNQLLVSVIQCPRYCYEFDLEVDCTELTAWMQLVTQHSNVVCCTEKL